MGAEGGTGVDGRSYLQYQLKRYKKTLLRRGCKRRFCCEKGHNSWDLKEGKRCELKDGGAGPAGRTPPDTTAGNPGSQGILIFSGQMARCTDLLKKFSCVGV